jgi:MerR-like DNA binding protein
VSGSAAAFDQVALALATRSGWLGLDPSLGASRTLSGGSTRERGRWIVEEMNIGEFARRSRLSPKALRLYDGLGLLSPARVDDRSGYRLDRRAARNTGRLKGKATHRGSGNSTIIVFDRTDRSAIARWMSESSSNFASTT